MEWHRNFGGQPARGGISLTGYSQWPEWSDAKFNWRNFTVLQLDFEYSPYKDSWEINFGLFGFCACFTRWWRGQFLEQVEPIIADINSGAAQREGRIVPLPERDSSEVIR